MGKSPEATWLLLFGLGQNRSVSPGTLLAYNSLVECMTMFEPCCALGQLLLNTGTSFMAECKFLILSKRGVQTPKTFCLQILFLLMPLLSVV